MRHISAHYDGEKVVLDEPVSLSMDMALEVVIPDSTQDILGLFVRTRYLPHCRV